MRPRCRHIDSSTEPDAPLEFQATLARATTLAALDASYQEQTLRRSRWRRRRRPRLDDGLVPRCDPAGHWMAR